MAIDGNVELASHLPIQVPTRSTDEIAAWIVRNVEEALELETGEMDADQPFDEYGLDSVEAVNLISALEDWLGHDLAPNLAYEYSTARELAAHLSELSS